MKTYNKIVSILFLSIYSAVVCHNVVPHFHFNSTSKESLQEIYHASHDHQHEHHHAHHEDEKSTWTDYILGLLGDIQHIDLGDDHFENFTSQVNHFDTESLHFIDVEDNVVYIFLANSISLDTKHNQIEHPKILYEQHHVCSSPLRGPPSIS